MQCNAHEDMIKCNTQANDMATAANNWRTPGASNPGRYISTLSGGLNEDFGNAASNLTLVPEPTFGKEIGRAHV